MNVTIREMGAQDYEGVATLWRACPGVGLSDSDTRESVSRFLDANPGISFVARDGDRLIGAVLCGHDGRRGYITKREAAPAVVLAGTLEDVFAQHAVQARPAKHHAGHARPLAVDDGPYGVDRALDSDWE